MESLKLPHHHDPKGNGNDDWKLAEQQPEQHEKARVPAPSLHSGTSQSNSPSPTPVPSILAAETSNTTHSPPLPPPLSPSLYISSTQYYSPTRAELESHPIIQRSSHIRDEIVTGLGIAPATDDSRQAPSSQVVAPASAPAAPAQPVAMANTDIKEGDDVSWQWSGGRPGGKAADVVTEGEAKVTSKKGNEIKKNADPENPAVVIERSGNNVVKRASELDVDKEGDGHKGGDDKKAEDKKEEKNGDDAKAGEKRKADDEEEKKDAEEEKEEKEAEKKPAGNKKQKTAKEPKENGDSKAADAEAPKKKGRPAKKAANGETAAAKKETKKREPKKAATESGEPRRSGRNASK